MTMGSLPDTSDLTGSNNRVLLSDTRALAKNAIFGSITFSSVSRIN